MSLKDKIYEQLVESNLFNKNYNAVINRLAKTLKKSNKIIAAALKELVEEKSIKVKNKTFINMNKLYKGTFHSLKNGKGLVDVDELGQILVNNNIGAQEGDLVQLFVNSTTKKPFGALNKVEKHNNLNLMGRVILTRYNTYAFIPENQSICKAVIIDQDFGKECVGKKCMVTLESRNIAKNMVPFGKITKVFGLAGDPIAENVSIAYNHGFVKEFSSNILNEIKTIPTSVTEEEFVNRIDLRDKKIISIDPKTCKDKDDAVLVERTNNGYRVYVAIADVAHYVKLNSLVDKEAYQRGTSCYLGDGVYPMLPEQLSNGICSLNENVDRLVKVAIIDVDRKGKVINYDLSNGVINIKHGLSYEEAEDIHFNKNDMHNKYSDIKPEIDLMFELSDILTKQRISRGALDFDTKQAEYILDDTKTKVLEVSDEHSKLESTEIIESFMILANEVVGDYFLKNGIDTLFRTHSSPMNAKLNEVNVILSEFGITPLDANVRSYQKVIKEIENHKHAEYLTQKILRSMEKAKYSPKAIGHFGLSSKTYLHFTSPIRRYPDLITHRILDALINHKTYKPTFEQLEINGLHLSQRELDAQHAERESNKLMQAIWAEEHIGEVFNGKIFDIMDDGIIVKDGLVEMYIPITDLSFGTSKVFTPNNTYTKLIDRKSKFEYNIGDKIKFKIISADRTNRKITATTDLQKIVIKPKEQKTDIIDEFFKNNYEK